MLNKLIPMITPCDGGFLCNVAVIYSEHDVRYISEYRSRVLKTEKNAIKSTSKAIEKFKKVYIDDYKRYGDEQ